MTGGGGIRVALGAAGLLLGPFRRRRGAAADRPAFRKSAPASARASCVRSPGRCLSRCQERNPTGTSRQRVFPAARSGPHLAHLDARRALGVLADDPSGECTSIATAGDVPVVGVCREARALQMGRDRRGSELIRVPVVGLFQIRAG